MVTIGYLRHLYKLNSLLYFLYKPYLLYLVLDHSKQLFPVFYKNLNPFVNIYRRFLGRDSNLLIMPNIQMIPNKFVTHFYRF
ncbi:hypothetical protein Xhom_03550 [Xenorhabdus hominickii]|uniref:Uncharacterized protein n=1 Tax=Xenorhabdus hominickii TaxID=351679 RepID=A0A2G0Q2X0_XENHO|nr:hypothetical protein Xhom_03550 [Xenorhabdus hominickii]